ncbi:MAG: biotin transporter BioY [Anaerolineales bacterium]|nr:biotin transporter BioY [Anaerolineales bacterium]
MQTQAMPLTLIDAVLPKRRIVHNVMLVVVFSVLIALSAQIAIPLPFTPVPITMQTLTVLLTGLLLGSRLGMATLIAYLVEGGVGLPVFTQWGSGLAHLLGPTGGYLIGFVFAAGLVGFLAERGWDRRIWTTLLAMILGNLVIYAFGVTWLSTFLGVGRAIAGGMLPFLIGDAVKIALAMVALPGGWALLRRGK